MRVFHRAASKVRWSRFLESKALLVFTIFCKIFKYCKNHVEQKCKVIIRLSFNSADKVVRGVSNYKRPNTSKPYNEAKDAVSGIIHIHLPSQISHINARAPYHCHLKQTPFATFPVPSLASSSLCTSSRILFEGLKSTDFLGDVFEKLFAFHEVEMSSNFWIFACEAINVCCGETVT